MVEGCSQKKINFFFSRNCLKKFEVRVQMVSRAWLSAGQLLFQTLFRMLKPSYMITVE